MTASFSYWTVVCFIRLKANVDPMDTDGLLKPLYQTMDDTACHAEGFLNQYWGVMDEDPHVFVIVANFQNRDDHHRWVSGDMHQKLVPDMLKAYDVEKERPVLSFIQFTPDAQKACEAPMTELTFYFVPDAADDEQKRVMEERTMKLGETAVKSGLCLTYASGWADTPVEYDPSPTGKALTYTSMFGWGSVEDHNRCKTVPEVGACIPPIVEVMLPVVDPPETGKTVCHVKFHKVAKRLNVYTIHRYQYKYNVIISWGWWWRLTAVMIGALAVLRHRAYERASTTSQMPD